jgi:ATP-dependent Clp protease ATP-binding subunit ClpB
VIEFNHLQKENLAQIVRIQLKEVVQRLENKNIHAEFSEDLILWLSDKGYDPVYGARPLKRLIQSVILNSIAKQIIAGELKPDIKYVLDIKKNELVVLVK